MEVALEPVLATFVTIQAAFEPLLVHGLAAVASVDHVRASAVKDEVLRAVLLLQGHRAVRQRGDARDDVQHGHGGRCVARSRSRKLRKTC